MKKRYYILVSFVILGFIGWYFGSTTHSHLKGTDAEKLTAFMDQKASDIGFNGTVLVAKEGEVLFSKGYGYADKENEIANTPDTVFHIASLSKSFTALSILQLEELGKLQTEDPISNYFEDFPNGDRITVHHLLNHSSGIPELLSLVENGKEHTLEELYVAIKTAELEFEPGSKYSYSNSGYFLLALIIEKLSELSLADYIQEHIIEPAEMKHTYFVAAPVPQAIGYENMEEPTHLIDISIAYGAGNMLSITGDLLLFDKAINEGKLLSKKNVDKMQTGNINAAPFGIVQYGYGWSISESWYSFNHKAVAHVGGFTGFKNFLLRFLRMKLRLLF
ncbi:beta-lactamase family protein [Anaerobacillus sp. CMMVII]|uniref:serine hydrolase domain-containing protein n=1 Tax=Anaerobacillus sp. CMMVII TaxID=2755588 RepID=UPI0021B75BFD|nr:serine hydrolase domain-containing protein [Anaerobacillus sp. CMMVII]MCT8136849.1 beta-lactamase family protein [Anaerobacillus sp. CMMVII]